MNSLLYALRSKKPSQPFTFDDSTRGFERGLWTNVESVKPDDKGHVFEFINGSTPLTNGHFFYNLGTNDLASQEEITILTDIPGYRVWINDELTEQNPGSISCNPGDKVSIEYDAENPYSEGFSFHMYYIVSENQNALSLIDLARMTAENRIAVPLSEDFWYGPSEILTPMVPFNIRRVTELTDNEMYQNCAFMLVIMTLSSCFELKSIPSRFFENLAPLIEDADKHVDPLPKNVSLGGDAVSSYVLRPFYLSIPTVDTIVPEDVYGGLENCAFVPYIARSANSLPPFHISNLTKLKSYAVLGCNEELPPDYFANSQALRYLGMFSPLATNKNSLVDLSKNTELEMLEAYSTFSEPLVPFPEIPDGWLDNQTKLQKVCLFISDSSKETYTAKIPRNLFKNCANLTEVYLCEGKPTNTALELEFTSPSISKVRLFTNYTDMDSEATNSCTVYAPQGSTTQTTFENYFSGHDSERFKVIPV